MISFKKPTRQLKLVDEMGLMDRNWFLYTLDLTQRVQFNPVNTSGGNVNFSLGPAKKNQGVEVIVKKVTGDANTVTAIPTGTDTVDNAGFVSPLTVAAPVARYFSDGISTWYRIG